MKKCPLCAEDIQDEAIKCKHCGESLKVQTPAQEETKIDTHPIWAVYSGLFLLGFVLLFAWGIGILLIIGAILDRNSRRYTVTTKKVISEQGVFAKHRDEISINDMRSVTTKQSIDQRLLKCGDILIGTAGTAGHEIIIKNIADHQKIADLITSLRSK